MERQFISTVEEDRKQSGVSELCRDVKECIFAKLPLQSICLSRLVCKEWNSLLSSHSFLSSLPTQNPWLLLCAEESDGNWYCVAYCFSTQKWMTLSFPFLPNPLGVNARSYNIPSVGLGLLLFEETSGLRVCNPLMRIYADIVIDVFCESKHIVQGGNGEQYLVVTFPHRWSDFSFQIYHYFQDSWKLKSQFSGETGFNIVDHQMVECNGVLFWRAERSMSIVGYNIQDDIIKPVTIPPLPAHFLYCLCILTIAPYGSSLLVVTIFTDLSEWVLARDPLPDRIYSALITVGIDPFHLPRGIVIWELFQDDQDKLLWKWKEFARMPPHSLPQYIGECVCVGDYLCISSFSRDTNEPKVFAYNLREGFWQCLPQCPSQNLEIYRTMLSFEPKLIVNRFFKPEDRFSMNFLRTSHTSHHPYKLEFSYDTLSSVL